MIIDHQNSTKTKLILTSIIGLAAIFILISIVLIYKVNNAQELVKQKVITINNLSTLKSDFSTLNKTLRKTHSLDDKLLKSTLTFSAEQPELNSISSILARTEPLYKEDLNNTEVLEIQKNLVQATRLSTQLELKTRNELVELSQVLANFWTYNHLTLIIACLLMIILGITTLYIGKTKRLLAEIQSKNKFIFNNSITLICSSDSEGNIVEFNTAALKAFGYSTEEVKNLDFRDLYKNQQDINKVREALDNEGVFEGEIINKRKDGSLFVAYLSANVLRDENNNVIGTMGISRDITREKEKEQEFHNIINNAQDIIYTVDTEGKVTFANSAGSSVMGYQKDELLGKFFTEMVHPDHVDFVRKYYLNQYRTQTKRSYIEFKGITKNREVIWLGQNVTTLFSPTKPDIIIGFQGVVRNINKRKIAEQKLKKSEESFRIIVNTINDLFYLFDFRTDRFEYISPNTEEVLGIEQEFFYSGKSFFTEYVHSDDLPTAMKAEAQLLKGDAYNIEYRVVIDGRTRWIHDRAFPIMNDSGRVISYSGVSRDITKVKSAMLIIEQQNDEISQSITYAKNIQDSTLLDLDEIVSYYEDCFVYFNPRDVLSGDFYLLDNFQTQDFGTLTVFVVADCTGHGVPGGMLSFLCNSLLREAFASPSVNSTAEVLDFAKAKLAELFRSNSEKHIYDGMDISICAMTEDQSTLYFSGANLPLTIIRNGNVIEIKGDRQHVGYSRKPSPFETQIVDLEKNDMIYLFSDGYQDQFGGEQGKKFMKRRLKELLIRIHNLPLQEQFDELKLEFHNWKGSYHQVDDVCVMGIRV